jgi:hypothetical protein
MKTITLKQAYQILENSSAVIVDDAVVYPSLYELTGEDDNEFLFLSWEDGDYHEFNLQFLEANNGEVKVSGSSLFLYDHEGEETQLTILAPQNLE